MESTALFLSLLPFLVGGCNLDGCTRAYEAGLASVKEAESSPAYCQELRGYAQCVRETAKSCHGELQYHSTWSMLSLKMRGCPKVGGGGRRRPPPPPRPQCAHPTGGPRLHCGLFGDPHLKTFDGRYQTCRLRGAWPLLDNPFLAVQVTNILVDPASQATAATKVTIIIKGRATPCAKEKTYEATAEAPLPHYFIDGTDQTGPEGSVVLTASNEGSNQKVEIYLRYIDTTLIIRRVGDYLGFSGSLPKEILDANNVKEELELCSRGCPSNELLDLASARGHQLSWDAAYAKCLDSSNLDNEIKNNLTDHFLDWCVFDVMTAGNQKDFISAAHSALADVLKLDPESLQNRTVPLELNQTPPSSLAYLNTFSAVLVVVNLLCTFLV